MIYFLLGIITGIILALIVLLAVGKYRKTVETVVRRIEEYPKEKGAVLEPRSRGERIMEENDAEGKDTPIGDIL